MLKKICLFIAFTIILSSFSCLAAETFDYEGVVYSVGLTTGGDDDSSQVTITAESFIDSSSIKSVPSNLAADKVYELLNFHASDRETNPIASTLYNLGSAPITVKKSSTVESLTGGSDGYYDENGFFIPPSLDSSWGSSSTPVKIEDDSGIKVVIKETFAGIETRVSFPDQKPVVVDGRTLVPARGVFEQLGYTVDWDDEASTALVSDGYTTVKIPINSTIIYKNDSPITLDVPAQLIGGRTMLPLRAVSEALNLQVEWVERTNTVIIHLPF